MTPPTGYYSGTGSVTFGNWIITSNTCTGTSSSITMNESPLWSNTLTSATSATTYTPSIIITGNVIQSGTVTYNWSTGGVVHSQPGQVRRVIGQLSPAILKSHRGNDARASWRGRMFDNASPAEMLALQLLRRMVGPDEFRRYLKNGFVSVRGPSGLTYQIDRQDRIKVWEDGVAVAWLCVHLKATVGAPPSDHVAAKILIVQCDEPDIWKRSNVTWIAQPRGAACRFKGGGSPVLQELLTAVG